MLAKMRFQLSTLSILTSAIPEKVDHAPAWIDQTANPETAINHNLYPNLPNVHQKRNTTITLLPFQTHPNDKFYGWKVPLDGKLYFRNDLECVDIKENSGQVVDCSHVIVQYIGPDDAMDRSVCCRAFWETCMEGDHEIDMLGPVRIKPAQELMYVQCDYKDDGRRCPEWGPGTKGLC